MRSLPFALPRSSENASPICRKPCNRACVGRSSPGWHETQGVHARPFSSHRGDAIVPPRRDDGPRPSQGRPGAGERNRMLVALLALLGVNLIVVVALLG